MRNQLEPLRSTSDSFRYAAPRARYAAQTARYAVQQEIQPNAGPCTEITGPWADQLQKLWAPGQTSHGTLKYFIIY